MMRAMRTHLTLAFVLSVGVASAALAADPPKKDAPAAKGTPMLTKEQLRSCMNQKTQLAQLEDELGKEQAAIAALKQEIARDGDALKAKLETVDRTNAEAVNAYNEQAQARDKQVDAFQARATAFNARVDGMTADREAYAKNCSNRRYLEEDETAIKKGK